MLDKVSELESLEKAAELLASVAAEARIRKQANNGFIDKLTKQYQTHVAPAVDTATTAIKDMASRGLEKAQPHLDKVPWTNPGMYPVYGALAGAGLGAATSLARPKERRHTLRSMLTGGLAGGLAGGGLGLLQSRDSIAGAVPSLTKTTPTTTDGKLEEDLKGMLAGKSQEERDAFLRLKEQAAGPGTAKRVWDATGRRVENLVTDPIGTLTGSANNDTYGPLNPATVGSTLTSVDYINQYRQNQGKAGLNPLKYRGKFNKNIDISPGNLNRTRDFINQAATHKNIVSDDMVERWEAFSKSHPDNTSFADALNKLRRNPAGTHTFYTPRSTSSKALDQLLGIPPRSTMEATTISAQELDMLDKGVRHRNWKTSPFKKGITSYNRKLVNVPAARLARRLGYFTVPAALASYGQLPEQQAAAQKIEELRNQYVEALKNKGPQQ